MADVLCLSHLRWESVRARPEVLAPFARDERILFFQDPIFSDDPAHNEVSIPRPGVTVVVPHLPFGLSPEARNAALRQLLDRAIQLLGFQEYVLWYYTAEALRFSEHLSPRGVIHDCVDERAVQLGAPRSEVHGLRDSA